MEVGEDEYRVRNEQVRHRVREVRDTLTILEDINDGSGRVKNLMEADFNMEMLRGRMDLSRPVLAGHSLGGEKHGGVYNLST